MKAPMKLKGKNSLLKKTGSRAESPNFGRSYYRKMFNDLVKNGMSKKDAARKVQSEAQNDIKLELNEFFNM